MADARKWDKALAFCQEASALEPNAAAPYTEALLYADKAHSTEAMKWAAGNLIKRDWPVDNDALHLQAKEKLKQAAAHVKDEARRAELEDLLNAVSQTQDRDLVVQLGWSGEAYLDLEVKEPVGTVCSYMHRQSPGGGTLVGSGLAKENRRAYVCAEGFAGDYQVKVRRIWGQPLGAKATLTIIEHQGTPQETQRRETVVFDREQTVTVALNQGRRTVSAQVPAEASWPRSHVVKQPTKKDWDVMTKMRALADPELEASLVGMQGGASSFGVPVQPNAAPAGPGAGNGGQIVFQAGVVPLNPTLTNLTAQATVSGDRRYVRLSVVPQFNGITGVQNIPFPIVHFLPGGVSP